MTKSAKEVKSTKDLPFHLRQLLIAAKDKVMRQLHRHEETQPYLFGLNIPLANTVMNDYEAEGYYDFNFVGQADGIKIGFIVSLYDEEPNAHISKIVDATVEVPDRKQPYELSLIVSVP